jgi:hypothetical protein
VNNGRIVLAGAVMIVLAIGFFFYMGTTAPRSTDPVGMMKIVGETSGWVGGIGLVMILFGLFRKKRA